jgi:hypothetical protein
VIRAVEWEVSAPGSTDTVSVRRDGEQVEVRWVCGDRRTFTLADLRSFVASIQDVAEFDAWVSLKDRNGYRFSAQVVDGRFYADRGPTDVEHAHSVDWAEFRKALKKASRDRSLPEPEDAEPESPAEPVRDEADGMIAT